MAGHAFDKKGLEAVRKQAEILVHKLSPGFPVLPHDVLMKDLIHPLACGYHELISALAAVSQKTCGVVPQLHLLGREVIYWSMDD